MFKVRVLHQGCSRPSSEPLSGWAAHTGVSPAWVCPASQTLLPLSGQGLFSCSVNLGVRSPPPHPARPSTDGEQSEISDPRLFAEQHHSLFGLS